jgi:hypothetical protein
MITPGKHSFTLYQGTTLRKEFTWTAAGVPVDLTGYTGRAQLRTSAGTAAIALDLTSANGGILVSGVTGKITMYATDLQTDTLTADKYLYDLDITNTLGDVLRLVEGTITISKGITR